MAFTQIITIRGADEQALQDLLRTWDDEQAGTAPGYQGARAFTDHDGQHVIVVDFSSEEEAQRNNDRPETQDWAARLRDLSDGEPSYSNLRQVYATAGR